jgi:CRP-like cAMP-binding protein
MKSILVVEENKSISDNLSEMLAIANYKSVAANDCQHGIELAHKYKPDLIISDMLLTGVDGLSMVHILRNDPETEMIPVIMLTATKNSHDFRQAMDAGANDCFELPYNNNELLNVIGNIFRMADVMKKHFYTEFIKPEKAPVPVNNQTIEKLTLNINTTTYQKKTVVYKQGKRPDYVYYIVKGKVRTYKVHEEGRQLVIGLYNSGDFLGYNALFEETPYKEIAETTELSELVCIPRTDFENMVYKNQTVANKLLKMLAQNITEREQQMIGNAYNTLRKKVAGALISLETKYKSDNGQSYCIDMSRNDIAAIAGTAAESLIRTLNEFKNEEMILIRKNHNIEIINSQKLHNLLR